MENIKYIPDTISEQIPGANKFKELTESTLNVISSWTPHGKNVFSEDWDILVILDACRADAIDEVAHEYSFLSNRSSIWSRGSATREWVAHTFTQQYLSEISQTVLVTANASSRWGLLEEPEPDWPRSFRQLTRWNRVRPDDFLELDEVWRYGPKDPYSGRVVPSATTDRAIANWRSLAPNRMIVHYIPPHHPYVSRALKQNRQLTDIERTPWEALNTGTDRSEVWERYIDDLRWGLESVKVLIDNTEADRIVISADHGDAFGEFGIYSHPMIPIPALRKVPWVITEGKGQNSYSPKLEKEKKTNEGIEAEVEEQLQRLGYK